MKKEKHILINNIHRYFGVQEDIDDMINYAHSSLHHWKLFSGGTAANVQRGEYMVAKAYALAGNKNEALRHAKKCLELTVKFPEEMKDFDLAFANEVMAMAHHLNKNKKDFKKYLNLAGKKGSEIKDKGDRKVFFDEIKKYIRKYQTGVLKRKAEDS